MLNIVLLPATEPYDKTYGEMPRQLKGYPQASIHHVSFPRMVWYNREVRGQALEQIAALSISPLILVGFSKSGLGAWNITRTAADLISATIIFDAPVSREALPPWGTAPFYSNDSEWQEDLPMRSIEDFRAKVPDKHKLLLVSGKGFHDEMSSFSKALLETGLQHTFLPRPGLKHHWQSGWLEESLKILHAD